MRTHSCLGALRGPPGVTASAADVKACREGGSWRRLAVLARRLVAEASESAGQSFAPLLGGGTRLLLALEHRISDDIDLFIRDPQWIGFLSPRLNDRVAELVGDRYDEDANSLKLRFPDGEIDFIVAMSLLGLPGEHSEDTDFQLEPVAEVIAKKLFYRGWALTPRDLYDWWFVRTRAPELAPLEPLGRLLSHKLDGVGSALSALAGSERSRAIWSRIRAPVLPPLAEAIAWARQELVALAVAGKPS